VLVTAPQSHSVAREAQFKGGNRVYSPVSDPLPRSTPGLTNRLPRTTPFPSRLTLYYPVPPDPGQPPNDPLSPQEAPATHAELYLRPEYSQWRALVVPILEELKSPTFLLGTSIGDSPQLILVLRQATEEVVKPVLPTSDSLSVGALNTDAQRTLFIWRQRMRGWDDDRIRLALRNVGILKSSHADREYFRRLTWDLPSDAKSKRRPLLKSYGAIALLLKAWAPLMIGEPATTRVERVDNLFDARTVSAVVNEHLSQHEFRFGLWNTELARLPANLVSVMRSRDGEPNWLEVSVAQNDQRLRVWWYDGWSKPEYRGARVPVRYNVAMALGPHQRGLGDTQAAAVLLFDTDFECFNAVVRGPHNSTLTSAEQRILAQEMADLYSSLGADTLTPRVYIPEPGGDPYTRIAHEFDWP